MQIIRNETFFYNTIHLFQQVKYIILDLHSQLKNYQENFSTNPIEKFSPFFKILNDLAHLPLEDTFVEKLINDPEIIVVLPTIRKFYGNFLFHQEIDLAYKILNSPAPWQELYKYSLYPRYTNLVHRQGIGAKLKMHDRVAFIGGGAVPITLLLLLETFSISGTSIEVQPEVAEISQKVIKKLGVSKEIKVVASNEGHLEKEPFDAIMVAALAEPKRRIFAYLKKFLEKRSTISLSYRTYTGMRMLLYDPVKKVDLEGFKEIKYICAQGSVNNTVCFLEKIS